MSQIGALQERHTAPDGPFERKLIRTRAGESRARKLTHQQPQEAKQRRKAGETSITIVRSFNLHHCTILRLCP